MHDPVERHVLNVLHRPCDTHRAHTDGHPLAVVLFPESPPHPTDGGLLEFHPGRADLAALDSPPAGRRIPPVLNFAYTAPGRHISFTTPPDRSGPRCGTMIT